MVVMQLPSTNNELVIMGDIQNVPPDVLFEYWTKPDLIKKWWPPEAEIEPRLGGSYHLSWPQRNWHLRGHYTSFDPGKKLAFTWHWDHDPESIPVTEVVIVFESLPNDGTRMTLTHGSFSDSVEDQQMRADHLEGWEHFIGKLQDLKFEENRT